MNKLIFYKIRKNKFNKKIYNYILTTKIIKNLKLSYYYFNYFIRLI